MGAGTLFTDHPEVIKIVRDMRVRRIPHSRIAEMLNARYGTDLHAHDLIGKLERLERAETRLQMRGHSRPIHGERKTWLLGS